MKRVCIEFWSEWLTVRDLQEEVAKTGGREVCVNDLDSMSSYLEDCDETLSCIKARIFVYNRVNSCS
jgi:hypothetical protein